MRGCATRMSLPGAGRVEHIAVGETQAVISLVNPEKLDHLGLPIGDLAVLLQTGSGSSAHG